MYSRTLISVSRKLFKTNFAPFSAPNSVRLFSDPAAKASTKISPEVNAIVESICKLNVLEMSSFVTVLKDRLGIKDSAIMAAAPAAAPKAEEKKEKKDVVDESMKSYSVKLTGFNKADKIKVIKMVRELFKLGLKESKTMVDSVPIELAKDMQKAEAETMSKKLDGIGGKTEIIS